MSAVDVCPTHRVALIEETVPSLGLILRCPHAGCQVARLPNGGRRSTARIQKRIRRPSPSSPGSSDSLKLPGLDPGVQSRRAILQEDPAQEAIVRTLRRDGYTVLVTTKRHKRARCEPSEGGCGRWFWAHSSDGCDRGIPDLLVSHPLWPRYLWLGIECKGTTTALSKEQKVLREAGRICVVRAGGSLDETVRVAQDSVRVFEESIGLKK